MKVKCTYKNTKQMFNLNHFSAIFVHQVCVFHQVEKCAESRTANPSKFRYNQIEEIICYMNGLQMMGKMVESHRMARCLKPKIMANGKNFPPIRECFLGIISVVLPNRLRQIDVYVWFVCTRSVRYKQVYFSCKCVVFKQ